MVVRWLRLSTGLVLAVYIVLHLVNLALGIVSFDAMEAYRVAVTKVWYHPVGGIVLYASFLIHYLLALWSLYRRSNLRLKAWEAVQLTFGLLILPLAAGHMIGVRLRAELFGVEVTYYHVVAKYWLSPLQGWRQVLLVAVVWLHVVVGLHYWLRLKRWYPAAIPYLYLLAALIPVLALLGLLRSGMTLAPALRSPELMARFNLPFPPSQQPLLYSVEMWSLAVMAGLLLATLAAREIRRAIRNRFGSFRLSLESGRNVTAPLGLTMLEAIRSAGIPHASVCGGRGRCTTCRVRINAGLEALHQPNETEKRALARIDAPRNVRLACQTRPRRDLAVMPLLAPTATAQTARRLGGVQGHEQTVTVMFVDLRGSTSLGERLLPYDAVFVLNRFFAELAAALKDTGGHYAQFNGDGLMALYGLETGIETGCREALAGAAAMFRRLDTLNRSLETEMGQALRMGIGIHTGEAIVGTMGPPDAPTLTAVGDTVNVAARLEAETKTFNCRVVVSETTAAGCGRDFAHFTRHTAALRGRSEPLPVYAVDDLETFAMEAA
jgi:adenylate cyclase